MQNFIKLHFAAAPATKITRLLAAPAAIPQRWFKLYAAL
jgi:hypothetical protein